tara:strand:+ start:518 stop:1090 length:573 start_codon:yes stop_codon:yes gene_type:complete
MADLPLIGSSRSPVLRLVAALPLIGLMGMQSACVTAPAPMTTATAALMDAQGSVRGSVTITDGEVLNVHVRAMGLASGVHAVHIHAVGRCDAPDFTTAGPHWNPMGKSHGKDNPNGPHLGDLPNMTIGADGAGELTFSVPARLDAGHHPLLDSDGAALVVHAGPDDMKTDPSGNSGGRIACGVIVKSGAN